LHTDVPEALALEQHVDYAFGELLDRLWARYYGEISFRVQTAQAQGLANVLTQILSGPVANEPVSEIDFGTAYQRVTRFLQRQTKGASLGAADDFRARYENDPRLKSVVDSLSVVEAEVEEAMRPRTNLQVLLDRLFTNKPVELAPGRVAVTMPNETTIPLSSLSSGEKHMLRLLVEALTGHANSIIIDEPEISLHIDWQQELVKNLRDLKTTSQLILATHSPEIMTGIADDNIFRL
jgi:hypothetical protein